MKVATKIRKRGGDTYHEMSVSELWIGSSWIGSNSSKIISLTVPIHKPGVDVVEILTRFNLTEDEAKQLIVKLQGAIDCNRPK